MSLRTKLLLLGLATLVLPWGGCQYARHMESVLREAERAQLATMAQTLAASLQGRRDLLVRSTAVEETRLGPYDLQAVLLPTTPFLDGYADEWPQDSPYWRTVRSGARELRILAGTRERMLYALLEVRTAHVILDAPGADALDSEALGDRVWIGFEDPQGAQHQYFIATAAPGPVRARRIETRDLGQQVAIEEPRIGGVWQNTAGGYRVVLRIPLSMLGTRFGALVDARDVRGGPAHSYGSLDPDSLAPLGRLFVASPELGRYLAQFLQPGLRLTVLAPDRAVLSEADALAVPGDLAADRSLSAQLYRRLLERAGDRAPITASAPIGDTDRSQIIGTVQVWQTSDRWLALRDQALAQLLDLTLAISVPAITIMFAFAAWLAFRLQRLRRASETALTREGLVTTFPDTNARDELGDVARSFSTLLGRLADYTSYLRTLAGKLAHEIRTPLTIVRSSLDNLETEDASPTARAYLARAREGSERLSAILLAMGAASRVEEAIQSAERTRFDLVQLLHSAVEAYRIAFPERRFALDLPDGPLEFEGAPDLIVQLLDKLIDNAVDFSPPGATLRVALRATAESVILDVENPGPRLPPETREHLFESLWQSRTGHDSRPHFGLGLYIVRLIAEFHGGHAGASNLADGSGVRFSIHLPS
jgi:two-component system, OmpR family, sensor histidine kinase ChvG